MMTKKWCLITINTFLFTNLSIVLVIVGVIIRNHGAIFLTDSSVLWSVTQTENLASDNSNEDNTLTHVQSEPVRSA